jgi:hypothetical protein
MSAVYGATPTQNNLLIAAANSDSDITMTSTGWSIAASIVAATGLYIYWKIAGAGESTTVTIGINVSDSGEMAIYEYSGNTASPLDKTATASVSGVASCGTGTTATTAQADELLFAAVGKDSTATWNGLAWTNSFVTLSGPIAGNGSPGASCLSTATRAVNATGAYTTTASWTDGNWSGGGAIATFKASVAAATVFPKTVDLYQAVNRAGTY